MIVGGGLSVSYQQTGEAMDGFPLSHAIFDRTAGILFSPNDCVNCVQLAGL